MKIEIKCLALYFLAKNKEVPRSILAKLIYLFDYYYAKKYGNQYTEIKWFYNHYGPFVDDIENAILSDTGVKVIQEPNEFGKLCKYFNYSGNSPQINDADILDVLNHVNSIYQNSGYTQFIKHVYNTSPMKKAERYSYIDIENSVMNEKNEIVDKLWDESVKEYDEVLQALAR